MSNREAERQKRLSEALRENLKRRKSQSRGRVAVPKTESKPESEIKSETDHPAGTPADDR